MVDWHLLCRRQLFRFEAQGDMAPKQAHQSRRLLVRTCWPRTHKPTDRADSGSRPMKTVEATAREVELEETPLGTPPTSLPAPGSPGAAPEAIEVNSTPQEEKQLKKQSRIRTQQLSSLAKHLDQALQYSHKTPRPSGSSRARCKSTGASSDLPCCRLTSQKKKKLGLAVEVRRTL